MPGRWSWLLTGNGLDSPGWRLSVYFVVWGLVVALIGFLLRFYLSHQSVRDSAVGSLWTACGLVLTLLVFRAVSRKGRAA